MRNLRKFTAVVIAIALVLTSMTAAFAATTPATTPVNADKAAVLKDLGLYAGTDANDVAAGLDGALTTQDSLIFLAKLFGYNEAASKLTAAEVSKGLAKFADAKDVADYAKNVVAYSAINGILSGSTKDGKFFVGAKDTVTAARFATFMLKQMGYTVPTFTEAVAQIAEVDGSKVSATETGDLTRDAAVGIMFGALTAEKSAGATVIADIIGTDAALKAIAAKAGLLSNGELAVSSIAANTAKSFLVKFTRPVSDEDKITFAVKRLSTSLTVTTSWNADKTEATIAAASNLAEATFAVSVLADAKEIAKEDIAITAQKVAKIEITSPSVAVTVSNGIGYVNYKVYDQYNNDITTTAMANSLTPQVGVSGYVGIKNGLMTIGAVGNLAVPSLTTLQSLSVVLYDSSAGVTATKALPISTTVGTLTDFQFGSADGIKLVEGDTTSVFYIPYTAKDMAGNETKDYDLIRGGLIDANATSISDTTVNLVVSLSSNVTATVVKDPANSKLAAVEVKYITSSPASNFVMDMPVTVTAMTYGGKSTSIQTTLTKAKSVETIMLMAPAETVAANESPEIPFEAYDKNGDKITSYSDIVGKITPNGFTIKEKADGSAKFVMDALANKGIKPLSANVIKSGKVSNMLSINVQDAAHPASLQFVQSGIVGAMEINATQKIEFGDDLKVYDQYDRLISDDDIDDKYFGTGDYYIAATVRGAASGLTATTLVDSSDITLTAAPSAGSTTLEFELFEENGVTDKTKDTASTAISIVKTDDIKNYTINTSDSPIYTVSDNNTITDREEEFGFNAKVYGLTSAGTKVLLAGNPIAVASLSNGTDFTASTSGGSIAYDGVYVVAKELADNKTSASTDLIITVAHNDTIKALKTAITSSTTGPVAKDIILEGADSDGIYDGTGSGVAAGTYMIQEYLPNALTAPASYKDETGATATLVAGAETNSEFYFYIKDSYGSEGMSFSDFRIAKAVDSNDDVQSYSSDVTKDGVLTINVADTGLTLYVTAITNNGLSATMKIVVD